MRQGVPKQWILASFKLRKDIFLDKSNFLILVILIVLTSIGAKKNRSYCRTYNKYILFKKVLKSNFLL